MSSPSAQPPPVDERYERRWNDDRTDKDERRHQVRVLGRDQRLL